MDIKGRDAGDISLWVLEVVWRVQIYGFDGDGCWFDLISVRFLDGRGEVVVVVGVVGVRV